MGVSFKQEQWSDWMFPTFENWHNYLKKGNYQSLKRAKLEQQISWYANYFDELKPELKQYLIDYLMLNYGPSGDFDSVSIMVINPNSAVIGEVDTSVFKLDYRTLVK